MQKNVDRSEMTDIFSPLPPISLEETNRIAKMLDRVDNKYVVDFDQFQSLIKNVEGDYSILEIDQRNQFSYTSCYYDDEYTCYYEHHQSRRQRFKVRTREYVDCGLKFFEVKLKGLRGQTNKHRIKCDTLLMPGITGEQLSLVQEVYREQYKKPMTLELKPDLLVHYKRSTLVALEGGERVTIDFGLKFASPVSKQDEVVIGNEFIIIETKSRDGMGIVDCKLKEAGIRKASKCSKYCLGVILTGGVTKNNFFLPTIRRVRNNIVRGGGLENRLCA